MSNIPISFSDSTAPTFSSNALTELTHYGLIAILGKKAFDFLQGQLTCDINEVTRQQSRMGAHCDPKGRVQFSFRTFIYQDIYYLLLPISMVPHALNQLRKYGVFFKIIPEDVSASFKVLGISGAAIAQRLNELSIPIPQKLDEVCLFQDYLTIRVPGISLASSSEEIANASASSKLLEKTPFETQRYIIIGLPSSIESLASQLLSHSSFVKKEASYWNLLDIYAGIANIYPETIGEFTPHHINYPAFNAVSFTKGCYTGQEIVARMQYLGKLKQHLYRGTIAENITPTPGTKLHTENNQEIGTVVEASPDISNKQQVCLAVISDSVINESIRIANSEFVILP